MAALFCALSLALPCARAQQSDALHREFLEYKAKAEQGDAPAQFYVGHCYAQGRGVTKDDAQAAKWFRKAAEQDYAKAQNILGIYYATGQGVEQDHAEAVKWYRKAAEQNLAAAQFNLGRCYAKGEGVEQDYVEACAWYDLAAKTLEGAAKSRDALEKQMMSTEQVVAVQRRAKELRAEIEAKHRSTGK